MSARLKMKRAREFNIYNSQICRVHLKTDVLQPRYHGSGDRGDPIVGRQITETIGETQLAKVQTELYGLGVNLHTSRSMIIFVRLWRRVFEECCNFWRFYCKRRLFQGGLAISTA